MSEIIIKAENLSKAYKIYERGSKDFFAEKFNRRYLKKFLRPHFADVL